MQERENDWPGKQGQCGRQDGGDSDGNREDYGGQTGWKVGIEIAEYLGGGKIGKQCTLYHVHLLHRTH